MSGQFVNLRSPEGRAFLQGLLNPDIAQGLPDAEAAAALRLIRWPDTIGAPKCPRCGGVEYYEFKTRSQFKCKRCHHVFTVLSSTVLSHNKLPPRSYLFALAIILDRRNWRSLAAMSGQIGCNYRTAWALFRKLRAGIDDPRGATLPRGLITRGAWLARRQRAQGPRGWRQPGVAEFVYPYLGDRAKADAGADLVLFVNRLVPRSLPDYVRADICQDMILAVLSGEATPAQIEAAPRRFVNAVLEQSPWKYKWVSFDAPAGPGGLTLHDLVSADG